MTMKKIILIAGVLIAVVAIPFFVRAIPLAPDALGGPIVSMTPCLYPFGGWKITLGPPSFGSYIYQLGLSKSFLFGPPWHIGQYVLGTALGGVSCATYYDDGWGGWVSGGLILYHGSSL